MPDPENEKRGYPQNASEKYFKIGFISDGMFFFLIIHDDDRSRSVKIWINLICCIILFSCVELPKEALKKIEVNDLVTHTNLILKELEKQKFYIIKERANDSNKIVLKAVSINGKSAQLLLDTGASSSFISHKYLEHFQLKKYDYHEDRMPLFKTAFGDPKADTLPAVAEAFSIGSLMFESWPFTVGKCSVKHGLLGVDFLCFTNAVIFCRPGLIGFSMTHSPAQNLDVMLKEYGYTEVELLVPEKIEKTGVNIRWVENGKMVDLSSSVFFVPFCFEEIEGIALVDTGAPFTIIDWDLAREMELRIDADYNILVDLERNIGTLAATKIKNWSIGNYHLGQAYVGVVESTKKDTLYSLNSKYRKVGVVGLDTLIEHNAIIDIGNKKLYFQR